jgi:hypothetical protein
MINRRELLKAFAGTCAVAGVREVQTDTIKDGDVIVLKMQRLLSHEEVSELKRQTEAFFPKQKVIVLTGGMDIEVLRKK